MSGDMGSRAIPKTGGFPYALSLAYGICLSILLGLGTWQLSRLGWKQELIADMSRQTALPAQDISKILTQSSRPDWRLVSGIQCDLSPNNLIYMHGINDGRTGFHVHGICVSTVGPLIVELGFQASDSTETTHKPLRYLGPIIGRLRRFDAKGAAPINNPSKDDWYWRDPTAFQKSLSQNSDHPIRNDYFVIADHKATGLDAMTKIGLTQPTLVATLTNRHLEYALTWYGLGLVLTGFFIALVRKSSIKRAHT